MEALKSRPGFKYGCDPELFVMDSTGKYVSADGLIPGTKDCPYKVDGGAVQVDGMAAEFNIDPVETFEDFDANITKVLAALKAMLPTGYSLSAVPAVTFDQDTFDNTPDDAKLLGCMPDFNAWTGEMNPPPHCPDNPLMRTASGHIHFGWTEGADIGEMQHVANCMDLVKQLDWYLGGWSIQHDKDPSRRKLYGKAGACRIKSYGVEYRVLSNFWVTESKMRFAVWNRMMQAIWDMQYGFFPDRAPPAYNKLLVEGINDTKLKQALSRSFKFPLTSLDASYATV